MEALLRCQVSHTAPEGRPQECCTNVLFQPRPAAHISDANGLLSEKRAQKLEKKQTFFFFSILFSNELTNIFRCVFIPQP